MTTVQLQKDYYTGDSLARQNTVSVRHGRLGFDVLSRQTPQRSGDGASSLPTERITMVTVILPAYNEEPSISSCIRSIYEQSPAGSSIQVIVVASGCTDKTVDIVCRMQRCYANLVVRIEEQRRGKASAIRIAKEMAKGEILILTDADVVLDPLALHYLLRRFRDPEVGAVCARVVPRDSSGSIFALLAKVRCDIWHRLRMQASAKNSLIMPSGYLYAIRPSLFPSLPTDIVDDDAYVGWAVAQTGYRFEYEPGAIVRPFFPDNLHDYLKQKIRTQLGRIQLHQISSAEISSACRGLLRESIRQVAVNSYGPRYIAALHLALDVICRIIAKKRFDSQVTYVPWEPIKSTKRTL